MSGPDREGAGDVLYGLLPEVYRQADAGQGYPLLALMHVFGHALDRLDAGLPELEAGWFIETCPLERVPAIGAMLGLAVPRPVRPEHRALVADALALARRRGRAAALPRLVRGATGWTALYAADADVPPDADTGTAAWPWRPTPTEAVRMPASGGGEAFRPVGLLFVWRLPVFAATDVTPAPIPAADGAARYALDPLGYERPLFNVAGTPLPMAAAAPVTALPVRLDRAMLAADLAAYRRRWPASGPPDSLLYGPMRGLAIRYRDALGAWAMVPPARVRAAPLGPDDPAPPGYPALVSGVIDPAALEAGSVVLGIAAGDTLAEATVALGPAARVSDLVAPLRAALAGARITRQGGVPAAAIRDLIVGAVGPHLAILPAAAPGTALTLTAPGGDPLRLAGPARPLAVVTDRLDAETLDRLRTAPAGTALRFAAGTATVSVPLPLAFEPGPDPVGAAAAAMQAALPGSLVRALDGRIAILPVAPARAGGRVPVPDPARIAADLAAGLGLAGVVGLDPVRGLLAWPSDGLAPGPPTLSVDYGTALLTGGDGEPDDPGPDDSGSGDPAPPEPVDPAGLGARLAGYSGGDLDLSLRPGAAAGLGETVLAPGPGGRLRLFGRAGHRPALRAEALRLAGSAQAARPARFALHGLEMRGALTMAGAVDLHLRDTALAPAADGPALGGTAGTVGRVRLARCRVGPIDLTAFAGTLDVADTAVGLAPGSAPVLTLAETASVRLVRSTVLGSATANGPVEAADTLFAGALTCAGPARFDHCFVAALAAPRAVDAPPGDASVSRCTACGGVRAVALRDCRLVSLTLDPGDPGRCTCAGPDAGATVRDCTACEEADCAKTCPLRQPGQLWEPLGRGPVLDPESPYPMPDFARLMPGTPDAILRGAADGDEIGLGNAAAPAARRARLDAALRDNLLFGTALDVRFET